MHHAANADEFPGGANIGIGGQRITARMIVSQDDAVSTGQDRWTKHFASVDQRLIQNSFTEDFTTEQAFARGDGTELSPRLGLVWKAAEAVRVRGAVYRAFRVPTLNEYYRPFRVGTVNTLANAALRRETLTGGEVGTEFKRGAVTLEAIFRVPTDSPALVNIDSAADCA